MLTKKHIFFICILLTAFLIWQKEAIITFIYIYKTNRAATYPSSYELTYWSNKLNADGPKKTYTEFTQVNKDIKLLFQHSNAHTIGKLIYAKVGMEGFAICDQAFGSGCLHGFFAAAVEKNGLKTIHSFDEYCTRVYQTPQNALSCSHGIGHGILSFLGYTKYADALKICDELTWKGIFGGCKSGVFMEYFLHSMAPSDTSGILRFNKNTPYAICPSVEEKFRPACYRQLAEWWYYSFHTDQNTAFRQIALYCQPLTAIYERIGCSSGIADVAILISGYNPSVVLKGCSYINDSNEQISCRRWAYYIFSVSKQYHSRASILCNDLSEKDAVTCRTPV